MSIFRDSRELREIYTGGRAIKEIYKGGRLVWASVHEPEVHTFKQPGQYTIHPPSWAQFIDLVLIGGGGGGACGDNSWGRSGNGGGAGGVRSDTLSLSSRSQISVSVGAGGVGGRVWNDRDGRAGGSSSIRGGEVDRTAPGGMGGSGFGGAAAGARQYVNVDGFYLPAGSPAGVDAPGMSPGDGGGGGSGGILGSFSPGQTGANGLVWLRFRDR